MNTTDEHSDTEMVPIDWRLAAFYAVYLTSVSAMYYYIGRRIYRAVFG